MILVTKRKNNGEKLAMPETKFLKLVIEDQDTVWVTHRFFYLAKIAL